MSDVATADVFERVLGQPGVMAQLRSAVTAPVHAYLLTGPPGAGARAAAEAFAAALLCPNGGCGECRDCRLALADERLGTDRDRLESAGDDFHAKVRAGYAELAHAEGWLVVDGSGTPDEVERAVWAAVSGRLGW